MKVTTVYLYRMLNQHHSWPAVKAWVGSGPVLKVTTEYLYCMLNQSWPVVNVTTVYLYCIFNQSRPTVKITYRHCVLNYSWPVVKVWVGSNEDTVPELVHHLLHLFCNGGLKQVYVDCSSVKGHIWILENLLEEHSDWPLCLHPDLLCCSSHICRKGFG